MEDTVSDNQEEKPEVEIKSDKPKVKQVQNYKQVKSEHFDDYPAAKARFDSIKPNDSQRVRLRRRIDGYAVVTSKKISAE